ncbi:hypothetical protein Taro_030408 [Colocasia esculenta]|uniref:Uncharacterized protein n=1 Tax=Colocasia esculenta TaxID=4460 RepID=A0A843VLC6_COLES|nr:hypothetical protein [Colocasia esculenta]
MAPPHDAYPALELPRRPGSYSASMWDDGYIQSLRNEYCREDSERGRMEKLKQVIRGLLEDGTVGLAEQLELVDLLQGLGVGRHFEKEVHGILSEAARVAAGDHGEVLKDDLSSTALLFRLLRQHGYRISQDVFNRFREEPGGHFEAYLHGDVRVALSLYEATLYGHTRESTLDAARAAALRTLQNLVASEEDIDANLREEVAHALELPLNRRIGRLQARWLLEMSTRKPVDMVHPTLLELAALDFNMVQSIHRGDLKKMSRWWTDLGLKEKLSFARDRLMENYFRSIGIVPDPQFSRCREKLTQVCCLISTIDDIYDEYGTYDELHAFTKAVERWEVTAAYDLPQYMQSCYFVLLNTVGQMCHELQREKGLDALPFLKKAWADLCRAFLIEAKWCYEKCMPTFKDYMGNAWMSISVHVVLAHAILFMDVDMTEKDFEHLRQYPPVICYSSTIFRLLNDLVERERWDTPSAIACYMNENSATEEAARRHIKDLIDETWSAMSQEITASSLPARFTTAAANVARLGHCLYQHGDGHSKPGKEFKYRVRSLLMEPIIPAKRSAAAEHILLRAE